MTRKSGIFRRLTLISALALVIFAAGCASNKPKDDGGVSNSANADENSLGDSDSGKAMGLQTVHFPFDSFVLDSGAKSTLKANADILKEKPSVKVQIEGHCDQRGGIQYNIALGEKRANTAKKFLEDLGVHADRMTVISFGKEKPVDSSSSEEAYAKNRRANFAITAR